MSFVYFARNQFIKVFFCQSKYSSFHTAVSDREMEEEREKDRKRDYNFH